MHIADHLSHPEGEAQIDPNLGVQIFFVFPGLPVTYKY